MSLSWVIQGFQEIKGVGMKGSHLCSYFSLEVCSFWVDGGVKWLFGLQTAPRRSKRQHLKTRLELLRTGLRFSFPKTTFREHIFTFSARNIFMRLLVTLPPFLLPSEYVCPFCRHLGLGVDIWEAGSSLTWAFARFYSRVQATPSSESRVWKSHVNNTTFFHR